MNEYEYSGEQNNKKKSSGFGKKLMKVVAIALVFGLVAGAAFQGSYYLVGRLTGTDNEDAEVTQTFTGGQISGTAVSTATTVT